MIDRNIRRLRRPQLNTQIYMGPSSAAGQPEPVATQAPDQRAQVRALEAQLSTLRSENSKQAEQLQSKVAAEARASVDMDTLRRELQTAQEAAAKWQSQVEDAERKLLEELDNKKVLDTAATPDKVWVTTIQARNTENGNAVVACTFHTGDETQAVEGTIYIPTSEIGKLRPAGNKDAGQR